MDIASAIPMIEFLMDKDRPTFLWGKMGVGKSAIAKNIANRRGLALIDFRALLRDPVDLRGLPVADLDMGKAIWLPPGDLPDPVKHKDGSLLFLDELNAATPMVMNACLGLVLDRKCGEYELPKNCRILAAGNRQKDRAAVNKMPLPLANRFCHIEIDSSLDSWDAWAARSGIHPLVRAFHKFRAGALLSPEITDQSLAFPTERTWEVVSGLMDAPPSMLHHLVAAAVGEGASAELMAFLKVYASLPSKEEIIANPTKARVPKQDEISALFAVSLMLAFHSDAKTFGPILEYGKRLPKEFECLLFLDATKRDNALCNTAAFNKFAAENKNLKL